ncbi:hypothetical protein [Halorubrum cibi]|uniref:Uncharacterized protein n=1 Tax=Halorubrum cibi TaxID=413815 RepID=A0A521EM72_9EURY|nr:hypothetical protein [Halorubrum cibi]SMO85002.1 hypothetical protein SAMN06264867_111103 [Halorubrum cibi]
MKRRQLILLLGGASSGAMTIGSGAFSSVNAERGVDVNVVEDENAYLGLKQVNEVVPADGDYERADEDEDYGPNGVVRVQNQFSDPLDLTVNVVKTGGVVDGVTIDNAIENKDDDEGLGVGEKAFISVECGDTGTGSVKLSFYGEAGGAAVETTQQFEFSCIDVRFNGEGTVFIYGKSDDMEVLVDGNKEEVSSKKDKATIKRSSEEIESVTVGGITYERPEITDSSDDSENNGQGQSENNGQGQSENNGQGQSENNGQGQSENNGQGQSENNGQGQSENNGQGQSENNGQGQSENNGQGP